MRIKIKILKAERDCYWYNDQIGEELYVYELDGDELWDTDYSVNSVGTMGAILKSDCVVIEEMLPLRYLTPMVLID